MLKCSLLVITNPKSNYSVLQSRTGFAVEGFGYACFNDCLLCYLGPSFIFFRVTIKFFQLFYGCHCLCMSISTAVQKSTQRHYTQKHHLLYSLIFCNLSKILTSWQSEFLHNYICIYIFGNWEQKEKNRLNSINIQNFSNLLPSNHWRTLKSMVWQDASHSYSATHIRLEV